MKQQLLGIKASVVGGRAAVAMRHALSREQNNKAVSLLRATTPTTGPTGLLGQAQNPIATTPDDELGWDDISEMASYEVSPIGTLGPGHTSQQAIGIQLDDQEFPQLVRLHENCDGFRRRVVMDQSVSIPIQRLTLIGGPILPMAHSAESDFRG